MIEPYQYMNKKTYIYIYICIYILGPAKTLYMGPFIKNESIIYPPLQAFGMFWQPQNYIYKVCTCIYIYPWESKTIKIIVPWNC